MTAPRFARRVVHGLEGAGAIAIFALFRLLPLEWASGLGGFLARSIGPRLAISRRAHRNLRRADDGFGALASPRTVGQQHPACLWHECRRGRGSAGHDAGLCQRPSW